MVKYVICFLALTVSLAAESETIEFIFTHVAEGGSKPVLLERKTRMEVTFDPEGKTGILKYYSPFSDSYTERAVKVVVEDLGIHFIEEKNNGLAVASMGFLLKEASYSNSTVLRGVLLCYQLYGTGRVLEKR